MYGVRNRLPFLSAAGRALMVVTDNYLNSGMVFLRIVMPAALILLKVLLTLPPLDFSPLLVESKVIYPKSRVAAESPSSYSCTFFPAAEDVLNTPLIMLSLLLLDSLDGEDDEEPCLTDSLQSTPRQ